jgi:hypothetical protein
MDKTVIYAVIAVVVIVAGTIVLTQSLIPGLSLQPSGSSLLGNNLYTPNNNTNSNSNSNSSNANTTTTTTG